ncbi:MMPL family transporter, partial [Francisellaceae bacterium]|nr:MMPL family transporter [Francisellaceae bacterium]
MKNKSYKIRLIGWLIIVSIAVIYFISLIISGFPLNTNVLSLLPKSDHNPVIEKAVDQFSQRMGNQVIFLLGNKNQVDAQKASEIFHQQLEKSNLFAHISYEVDANEQQAWGTFYFPYRLSLLTPKQKSELEKNNIKAIEQSALFNLYNPMGIANSDLLKNDPYFLFTQYITSIPKPASQVQLIDNKMMIHHHNTWYVMLNAELKGDSFSISNQDAVVQTINQATETENAKYPNSSVIDTGMLFYAKAGADDAQHDISTIGIGSIIGIILLILLTFRSLLPLVFILLSSAIGFICAFVATYLIFGSVYLFTLIFGASLIGISVDYAFFYYAEQLLGGKNWKPTQGLKNIFSGITLGLINIVIAYIIICFTP